MNGIFELLMMLCFGFSWPFSVVKSYRSKTATGKSLLFISLVWIGYICGIVGKIVTGSISYVIIFYVINLIMVTADIVIYFRNKKYDRLRVGLKFSGRATN
jgi:lipopolysaccharide export LptBFGC system permease protein LptF